MNLFKKHPFKLQLAKGIKPARRSLEAHLVNVAGLCNAGKGTLNVQSLEALSLVLIRERYWFRKVKRVPAEADVKILQELNEHDRPVLIILANNRPLPSAVIALNS